VIGIDISPTACRVMAKRLRDVCTCRKANRSGAPDAASSSATCRGRWRNCGSSRPFKFENWAVIALGGIPNKVQLGDMGVDGRIFPVFENSPAIYGWVRGSESSQVPSGTKEFVCRP